MAAAKKKAATAKKADAKKEKFGSNMRITGIPSENPRMAGTNAHDKWKAMAAFMKKKPTATVADVIAGTTYKRNDFEWDMERKAFKVVKA